MRIWGIDYGSKLAGTTAIASLKLEISAAPKEMAKPGIAAKRLHMSDSPFPVHLYASQKKKDADSMILELAESERPDVIFIDAPLSLPGAYFGDGDDFFYRSVDREVGAMSPMFLGGLTARAMRLKRELERLVPGIEIRESYPKLRAVGLDFIEKGYKKEVKHLGPLTQALLSVEPSWQLCAEPDNWHAFDALLALSSARRYLYGEHKTFGPKGGACIYV